MVTLSQRKRLSREVRNRNVGGKPKFASKSFEPAIHAGMRLDQPIRARTLLGYAGCIQWVRQSERSVSAETSGRITQNVAQSPLFGIKRKAY